MNQTYRTASKLVSGLHEASDALKRGHTAWVQECITDWYRALHWEIRPVTEVAENDLTDPVYESMAYKGNDGWEIVVMTTTHGREHIMLHACNGVY